jgi:APA family basic amino acid/polyamine antiporter
MPDAPRPYRVWGYPATSIIFIAFASVYIVFTLYTDIRSYRNGTSPLINSLMGLVWVALGIPGYLWWSLTNKPEPQPSPATSEAL